MNVQDTTLECLQVSQAHATLQLLLDEELGTLHGFGWLEFRLLHALARGRDDRLPLTELVGVLGLQRSAVVRQLLLLEKTGQVQRVTDAASGVRMVALRPAGRKQLQEAAATADEVCSRLAPRLWT